MSDLPRVGFIGLGSMGVGMAKNVVSNGYPLTIMGNTRREPVDRLVGLGATEVSTPAEVVKNSDVVILCVTTSAVVEDLVYGDNGILDAITHPITLIDCGTSDPNSTLKIGSDLAKKQSDMMDIPLGRSAREAEAGTLNMMAAGDEAVFEKMKPLLETMSENLFYLGVLGTGHKLKLINNFFSMSFACVIAEAVTVSREIDLDLELLQKVVGAGPIRSDFFDWNMAGPVEGDTSKLQFAIKNGCKDVGYFADMAKAAGVDGFMAPGALKLLQQAVEDGQGDSPIPALSDWLSAKQ